MPQTVLQIIENENGDTCLGVATDHVIESFRNRLWAHAFTWRWRGPTPAFATWAERMEAPQLLERCDRVKLRHAVLRE